MRTSIPWGDGSGDHIYLDYPASAGVQIVQVSSDAHIGIADRRKNIVFTATGGSPVTLTVVQTADTLELIVPVYNGVYPVYDDIARGFPTALPSGYTPLQYVTLKNTYIDTGEKTTQESVIDAKVYISSTTATYFWLSDSNSSGASNTTAYYSSAGNWRFGGKVFSIANSTIRGEVHRFRQSKGGVWKDGELVNSYSDVSSFTSSANLRFGSSASVDVRHYYFRHIKDGVTVSYFQPCLYGDVAGFYDHIKGEFKAGGVAGPVAQ